MRYVLWLFMVSVTATAQPVRSVDVCVYGGTSAGVMAAYSAAKLGKSVLLIEPGQHLGGLSSGGLGHTDIGNKYAITGLALDFYRRLGRHYGTFEQWIFEPHVAERLFGEYVRQGNVPVLFRHRLQGVKKVGNTIQEITLEDVASRTSLQKGASVFQIATVRAKQFIDCSYEGDLMARAGVRYVVGREANAQYGETWNGVQLLDKHQFLDGIDPYKTPADPASGLLWGISDATLRPVGTDDRLVQAYNFRLCLTDSAANRVAITRPAGYDSTRYELLLRQMAVEKPKELNWGVMHIAPMPNRKTDINNKGGFSTDMIGHSHDYPEASYAKRAEIVQEHERYVKGLLYFLGHDPRVPDHLRSEMLRWGYPKDEYVDNGHFSPQLYVREARRMAGRYVMTQANCEGRAVAPDAIGLAAYTMDSHNCQRIVIEKDGRKMVKNEGDVQVGGFPPYPISYQSLTPVESECRNLLVPVCLSATHIAYGSIRMEPVFMALAQAAAVAAVQALNRNVAVQAVNVAAIRETLRNNPRLDGSVPDVVVDNDDATSVQRTGAWTEQTRGGYGRSFWKMAGTAGDNVVRYVPDLPKTGRYVVYAYLPRVESATQATTLRISDGKQTQTVQLPTPASIEGQTSGKWVRVGQFALPAGRSSYVAIDSEGATGAVVADAVQWVWEGQ